MKTPEEALSQWVEGTIHFDGGMAHRTFHRDVLILLADAIRRNDPRADLTVRPEKSRIATMYVTASTFVDWYQVKELLKARPARWPLEKLTAHWLVAFDGIKEAVEWMRNLKPEVNSAP